MCAGVTTFNALRHSGAQAGNTVAILGIGGLGHMALQLANKMGFRTVAIERGLEKRELATRLGADATSMGRRTTPARSYGRWAVRMSLSRRPQLRRRSHR
jgi:D-arabinose 1-dehydrogenase-like Zn-dependent alcohol dehydrogenase